MVRRENTVRPKDQKLDASIEGFKGRLFFW
jgi:hypothetical protein